TVIADLGVDHRAAVLAAVLSPLLAAFLSAVLAAILAPIFAPLLAVIALVVAAVIIGLGSPRGAQGRPPAGRGGPQPRQLCAHAYLRRTDDELTIVRLAAFTISSFFAPTMSLTGWRVAHTHVRVHQPYWTWIVSTTVFIAAVTTAVSGSRTIT